MTVTLIGEKIAKVGSEFIYCGPIPDCRDCRLKNVCFALDEGRRYRITKVRDVKHECIVHEDGARVVEVEKTETPYLAETRLALSGSMITFAPRESCRNLACENYRTCYPAGLKEGDKLKIVTVGAEVQCPAGLKLTDIRLSKGD